MFTKNSVGHKRHTIIILLEAFESIIIYLWYFGNRDGKWNSIHSFHIINGWSEDDKFNFIAKASVAFM